MSPLELRDIEFKSDGLVDSLTLSLSPFLFHENLKREISISSREDRKLTIVSLTLLPEGITSIAELHEELIEVAHALNGELRGGDFFARISDCGFWLLLRTDEIGARLVMQRLECARRQNVRINFAARGSLNYNEWITLVDRIHFN